MGQVHATAFAIICAQAVSADPNVPDYAENTLLHVIAHEIGHAVIREFDLPILAPEEAMADDFATVLIHMMLPDRAGQIISDYATFVATDQTQAPLFSEYNDDVKRGARAICLAYGMDPDKYTWLAAAHNLDGNLAAQCRDSAPEVWRGWRRTIEPLMIPASARVTEVNMQFDDSEVATFLADSEVMDIANALLRQFDWHSMITLSIAACDSAADWSRNGRTITVCDTYIMRFAESR